MVFKRVTSNFKQKFFQIVTNSQNILITAHYSPDDDAISSALSLKYFLSKKYPKKNIDVAFTGNPVNRFSIFTGYSDIKFIKDIANIVDNYNTSIFLDGSQYSRFSNNPEEIVTSLGQKICIDHHSSPTDNFNLHLQNPLASSTAELVYLLVNKSTILDKPLSELLLLGILGDTGTFNYLKPNQYHVLSIVKKLLEVGQTEIQEFKSRYMLISQKVFFIIQEFIKNSQFLEVLGWPKFQISYITRDFINENNISDEDVSEANNIFISNYLRIIEDYPWGISFKPYSDGSCSLSLRSLPNCVSVRSIVEEMNIGGGHDRAAGGKIRVEGSQTDPEEALSMVTSWMKNHKPVIT